MNVVACLCIYICVLLILFTSVVYPLSIRKHTLVLCHFMCICSVQSKFFCSSICVLSLLHVKDILCCEEIPHCAFSYTSCKCNSRDELKVINDAA